MTGKRVVRLTSGAQRDIRDLRRYLGDRYGAAAATAFRTRLSEAIRRLEDYPYRGTMLPELEMIDMTDYRQIMSGINRVIYRVTADELIVLIIADGRRDLQSLLERRLLIG